MYKKGNEISAGESPDKTILTSLFSAASEHIQYSGKHSKQYHDKAGGNALFEIFWCISQYPYEIIFIHWKKRSGVTEAFDHKSIREHFNIIF